MLASEADIGSCCEVGSIKHMADLWSQVLALVRRWNEFRQEVLQKPGGKEILVSGRPDNYDVNWINDQIQDLLAVSLHSASSACNDLGAPGAHACLHMRMRCQSP